MKACCSTFQTNESEPMKTIVTSMSVDTAVEKLKAGVEAEGMRVVAHINGQANAAKMGKLVPADQILEILRPDFAVRVWEACKAAGHDIPLRIHVYATTSETRIACRMPSTVFAPFGSDALMRVAAELDEIFMRILRHIPEAEHG